MTTPTEARPTNNLRRGLQDLEDRQRAIKLELARIDEITEPTDEDVAWQETLITEFDANEVLATPLRKRAADLRRIQAAADEPENREPVEHQRSERIAGMRGTPGPDLATRTSVDPLGDMDRVRNRLVGRDELRTRARALIEQDHKRLELPDDFAETATVRAQASPGLARHILLTGSQEYRDAFRAYLEHPEEGEARLRAVNLTAASGGYLLPYVLDPTIVLTNNASANPFRRISRVERTTSNAWQGVNSAGVTGAWVAEAGTAADNSPTLGQIQITPAKGVAWVFGSYEALDDTDFGTQLPGLLADCRDRMESAAFTTGSGTTQPLGVVAAAYGTANATLVGTTGTIANTDIYNLQAALPPRFRNSGRAAWLMAITWINKTRAVDAYGGSSFWANFGSDTPEQLLGKNIYEASDLKNTTTAVTGSGGVVGIFGDWNQFVIVDRVGVSMLYEPMVKGTAGSIPTGQAGWYMFWRTGSGVATSAAFKFLVNGSAA